jgi:short subunit dehydrogenase-like uncharacterized protein
MGNARILVLGAYGLAGRVIVEALRRTPDHTVIASGRRRARLDEQFTGLQGAPVETLVLDTTDATKLRQACASANLVINAVGPFARGGADIARTVVDCGCHYVDCANEQIHYERLHELHEPARSAGVLLVTAAGLIPGLSTVLAAHLLDRDDAADAVDITFAQLRHAYADGGGASVMGGVLDAVYRPYAVCNGIRSPVTLGRSVRDVSLPAPFGARRLLEVPTIDVAVLAARAGLREIHTWFYLGEQPTWLFGLIRALNPTKRAWAYQLIDRLVERLNRADFARAQKQGVSPEALLLIRTSGAARTHQATVQFTDGASPLAVLPARIARDLARGVIEKRGLATPIDLYRWPDLRADLEDCVRRSDVGAHRPTLDEDALAP